MLGAWRRPRLWTLSESERRQIRSSTRRCGRALSPDRQVAGTAALSERDYVHRAIDRADLIITIGHDTVEKPPFLMGANGPTVLHVGYLPATVEEVFFPQAELVGDVGPSLTLLADRLEHKLRKAKALLPLREGILAHIDGREKAASADAKRIVHDVRQVMPEDGIVLLPTMACTSVCAQLSHACRRHASALTMRSPPWRWLPSAIMAACLNPIAGCRRSGDAAS